MVDVGDSAELGQQPALEQRRLGSQRASAIVVAGMHRSGTSAITRVLALLGTDLPRHLVPAIPNNNDLGFWESGPIGEAHDRFLASIGSAWDDVSPIPPSVFASAKADALISELGELLRDEYGDSSLFVVKDPRLCRLVPIWIAALERIDARPSFVIATRNPLEVAGSLKARDGFSATKSCLLWLRHLLDAERDSRGFPRVFVSYERLLRDWVTTTERIARELHLFWPRSGHETHHQIDEYLSSSLRHHSFDYSELRARSDVTEWVKQAFEAISCAATDAAGFDSELFDEIRAQLDRADHAYGPLLAQERAKTSEVDAARAEAESQLRAAASQLAERQAEFDSLNMDNQRVTARLVDEIETVAGLHRVLEGLAAAVERLARSLGDASAVLIAADGTPVELRTAAVDALDELRQRPTVEEEPEPVRHAVDEAIRQTEEFLNLLDDDRAGLLAALAERDGLLAQRSAEYEDLSSEARRLASAVADAETKLAERESALSEARTQVDAAETRLQAVIEELDRATSERESQLAEAERLLEKVTAESEGAVAQVETLRAAVEERDGLLAQRSAEYEDLSIEAGRLASAVADAQTNLAERESALSEARTQVDAAETRLQAVTEELDRAISERESQLAEAERLLEKVTAESEGATAELRRALSESETQLERREAELEQALAEREAGLAESERLQVTLTEQGEAFAMTRAESEELARKLTEQEERLDRTLEEARKLAAAVAQGEEALSERDAKLRERDEQLRLARSEVAERDELLVHRAERLDGLSTELRSRDETLAVQSELLAGLDAIGRARSRRWRSVTQFCSWLFPPTFEHLGYIRAYLHLRRSDLFDADYYLSRYLDVSHAGLNPLMHYVEHGRREGRQPAGSPYDMPSVGSAAPVPPSSGPLALPAASEPAPSEPVQRLRRLVREHVRPGCIAAVVSDGDQALLEYAGWCRADHLSQDRSGRYPGWRPESSRSAVAQLEAARSRGAEVLVVPESSRSWLEQYAEFGRYLERRYALAVAEADAGVLWNLQTASPLRGLDDLVTELRSGPHQPAILDWQTEHDVAALLNECNVFAPEQHDSVLPYLDSSIDVVVLDAETPERLAEARRVARSAVVTFGGSRGLPSVNIVWRSEGGGDRPLRVSLVIASRDRQPPSRAFLRQLQETLPPGFDAEVLLPVGDEDSPLDVNSDATVVRCRDEDLGQRLHRAVRAASTDVVVLIAPELWPVPGWLPPLVHMLHDRPDAGVASGLLVTPDGRVPVGVPSQNRAGGPPGEDPGSVGHSYVRRLQTAPGELFATHRQLLLDQCHDWSRHAEPVARYCAVVASDGLAVLSQPESLAIKPWPSASASVGFAGGDS